MWQNYVAKKKLNDIPLVTIILYYICMLYIYYYYIYTVLFYIILAFISCIPLLPPTTHLLLYSTGLVFVFMYLIFPSKSLFFMFPFYHVLYIRFNCVLCIVIIRGRMMTYLSHMRRKQVCFTPMIVSADLTSCLYEYCIIIDSTYALIFVAFSNVVSLLEVIWLVFNRNIFRKLFIFSLSLFLSVLIKS